MPQVRTVRPDGDAIRRLRVRRGLTQRRLEAMIGRTHGAVGGLELNKGRLASEILICQIANALGVEPEELIRDDDEDEPQRNGGVAA